MITAWPDVSGLIGLIFSPVAVVLAKWPRDTRFAVSAYPVA